MLADEVFSEMECEDFNKKKHQKKQHRVETKTITSKHRNRSKQSSKFRGTENHYLLKFTAKKGFLYKYRWKYTAKKYTNGKVLKEQHFFITLVLLF